MHIRGWRALIAPIAAFGHLPRGAAIAALLLAAATGAATAASTAASVEYVGTLVWSGPAGDQNFGGFSGIEISEDGRRFHAITDRAHLYWGSIDRDSQGVIRAMNIAGRANLKDSKGIPLKPGYTGDSEGLAIDKDGRIWISFEGLNRIARYDNPDARPAAFKPPPQGQGISANSGLEALAIREGVIHAIPERSGDETKPFPILTFHDNRWGQAGTIRRDPRWLAVGADFGPDGWFYLLERDFRGIFGFVSRVRRMQLTPDGPQNEEILLTSRPLQYDNLEGISVWHDGQGIRLTMISDDNFLALQRTELVEYRLRD